MESMPARSSSAVGSFFGGVGSGPGAGAGPGGAGGVGAGVVFHALCNIFSETLGKGYALY